ncbi:MAG: laccase domain-containing protein [Sedimentisphaerales bacterium]|nr:laccase domain-containing protein [Sedimentisphaerales bacterium]
MLRVETRQIAYLQFDQLAGQTGLRHGLSLRHRPDGREPAGDPCALFCAALGLEAAGLARHRQVHADRVAVVATAGQDVGEADGLCTDRPGIPLMLMGADCPLLIVYDPQTRALGLAHAGWRGTIQQIAIRLVETLIATYGVNGHFLLAGIGPAICRNCYEVGPEVKEQAEAQGLDIQDLFCRPPTAGPAANEGASDRWHFDLIEANRRQLCQAGIPADRIETSGLCTFERPDLLPSYRRDGNRAGRWILLAGLAAT